MTDKIGGPEGIRTLDLFHAMEARGIEVNASRNETKDLAPSQVGRCVAIPVVSPRPLRDSRLTPEERGRCSCGRLKRVASNPTCKRCYRYYSREMQPWPDASPVRLTSFTVDQRIRVVHPEHPMLGETGTVRKTRRPQDQAWVEMDRDLPGDLRTFPETDTRHQRFTLLWPSECAEVPNG